MPAIRKIVVQRTYAVEVLASSYEGARVEASRTLTKAFADGQDEDYLVIDAAEAT